MFLIPKLETVTGQLYARMFEAYPAVRAFFADDLTEQQDKLVDTLAALLDSIENREGAEKALRELGKRHVEFGATTELYQWLMVELTELIRVGIEGANLPNLVETIGLWKELIEGACQEMMIGAESQSTTS